MNFLKTGPSITLEEIKEVENKLNINFPREFIDHYLKYNGGVPENGKYLWPEGGKTKIRFSSIKYEGFVNNLEESYEDLVLTESYLPSGIVPFANDEGGNLFCISTRKEDYGVVYYCNNDHYNTSNKEECFTQLDKSFRHFIDSLSS